MKNIKYILLGFFVTSKIFAEPTYYRSGKLETPYRTDISSIETLLGKILVGVNNLLIPIIVLAIVYAGFMYVKAQGEPGELNKAKDALLWAVVGAVVVIIANGAYQIMLKSL